MEQKYKTLTKICGITNIEDARVAEDAGASVSYTHLTLPTKA